MKSWLAGGLDAEGARSYAQLARALVDLGDAGRIAPCQRPDRWWWWTSDRPAEREAAAWQCAGCPLAPVCADHAQHERYGVWSGVDRTPKQRTPPPGGPGCANP